MRTEMSLRAESQQHYAPYLLDQAAGLYVEVEEDIRRVAPQEQLRPHRIDQTAAGDRVDLLRAVPTITISSTNKHIYTYNNKKKKT